MMSRTWNALMIASDDDFDGAPRLRGEFQLDRGHGAVVRAVLYASGLGIFEAFLAGQSVSDEVLSPGWSSYEWRLRYRAYDVTEVLRSGAGATQPTCPGRRSRKRLVSRTARLPGQSCGLR